MEDTKRVKNEGALKETKTDHMKDHYKETKDYISNDLPPQDHLKESIHYQNESLAGKVVNDEKNDKLPRSSSANSLKRASTVLSKIKNDPCAECCKIVYAVSKLLFGIKIWVGSIKNDFFNISLIK